MTTPPFMSADECRQLAAYTVCRLHSPPSDSLNDLYFSSDHSAEPFAVSSAAELISQGKRLGVKSIAPPLTLDLVTGQNRIETTDCGLEVGAGDSTTARYRRWLIHWVRA